jgi:serralysin
MFYLGNDVLFGGGGRDFLIGGFGADIFQFSDAVESFRNSIDVIRDFLHGEGDTIDLTLMDANPATVAIEHFKFIGKQSFADFHAKHPGSKAVLLRFDAKHHTLQGDTHHNFKLDADDFQVTLAGVDHLVKGDLVLA